MVVLFGAGFRSCFIPIAEASLLAGYPGLLRAPQEIKVSFNSKQLKMFIPIDDISKGKSDKKLKVRIIDLWKKQTHRKKDEIGMVLMDDKGSRIEALIPSFYSDKFKDDVKEYSVVVLSNFSAEDHTDLWKIIKHPFIINFLYSTEVEQTDDNSISEMGIQLTNFNAIVSGELEQNTCVDVVGVIARYKDAVEVPTGNQKKASVTANNAEAVSTKMKMEIELEDREKNVLRCTLWQKYAEMVNSHINTCKDKRVVVIFQFLKVNYYRGNWEISNSLFGSKVHFNQGLNEIADFLQGSVGEESESELPSITRIANAEPTSVEEMYFNESYKRSTLDKESSYETGTGVFVAKVVDIEVTTSWYYWARSVHNTKVEAVSKNFCTKCQKEVSMPEPKFTLRIIACDDNDGILRLTLFDRFVRDYVGKTAATLLDQNPDSFPADLNVIKEKEYLFKIEINERTLQHKDKTSYQV